MPSTLDRLRRLNQLRPQRGSPAEEPGGVVQTTHDDDWLRQGHEVHNEMGTCYVVKQTYTSAYARGGDSLGTLLNRSTTSLARIYPGFHLDQVDGFEAAAFIDTETTGLGTGAGVYAFMVGVGTFDPVSTLSETDACVEPGNGFLQFVVRQYFMRNPAEELALLRAFTAQLTGKRLLVTFNGRSFDAPLLRARMRYNRPFLSAAMQDVPLLQPSAPHLDLLMPARRLWRRRLASCRLAHLEEAILGHERTESDVPGYLIPQLYTDYVRNREPGMMGRVFYHNREDIVSMVGLANELSLAFGRLPADSSAKQPRANIQGQDWLSLAITYERMQEWANAEPAYRRALEDTDNHSDKKEIFLRLGKLQKRQGRWEEAAETWQLWLTSVPGSDPSPYVELAKYCEWQLRDYEQAEMWVAWAIHNLRQEESAFAWTRTIDELEHRLQRIRRKREKSSSESAT